jgi:hypothetical protein
VVLTWDCEWLLALDPILARTAINILYSGQSSHSHKMASGLATKRLSECNSCCYLNSADIMARSRIFSPLLLTFTY